MSEMISFNDAAKMLNVSRNSIHNYVAKGLLTPYKQFNGRVLFDRAQVSEVLLKGMVRKIIRETPALVEMPKK